MLVDDTRKQAAKKNKYPYIVTIVAASVIGMVWIITTMASLFTREYQALAIVTPVMTIAVGVIFGRKVVNGG
jgi:hypothetical protein